MKRDISVIGYILIIFTVGVILRIYLDSDAFNLNRMLMGKSIVLENAVK